MTVVIQRSSALDRLIERLDHATLERDPELLCEQLKGILSESAAGERQEVLAASLVRPIPERYARRLVHQHPDRRYTMVAMVWGVGQGTPLHDHAGSWCVECVYQGRIRVTSYDLDSPADATELSFRKAEEIVAGLGEAGALIPPYEYHTIDNPFDRTAVTLHVYGGEMTWCNAFEPLGDGRYRKRRRELGYDD